MSYWDTSALVKLSLPEQDSHRFVQCLSASDQIVTAAISFFESRNAFWRREAEGSLGEETAVGLSQDLDQDVMRGKIRVQPANAEVELEFSRVLERCYSQTPPVFIRTNDALHLASAIVAEESTFVSADLRQRTAAVLLGFTVLPATE